MFNRNGCMTGILQLVVTIALMFLLASSAGSHYCSVFPSADSSEPASEGHRTCSLDENAGRVSRSIQPAVINQLRNKIRDSATVFQRQHFVFAPFLLKPAINKENRYVVDVFLSTTVLRI
jgi:hypothetical protein